MIDATAPRMRKPTLADRIAPHLPLLRRYARALTGSQGGGDAYVGATLEAVIADHTLLDPSADLRVALYALFQKLWNSVDLALPDQPSEAMTIEERIGRKRLGKLSPPSRQALLLTAVEGFSLKDAALVLGVTRDEAERLVSDSVAALRRQTRSRVMIIEDEPIIAMDLQAIVTDLGHEVVGIADTRDGAVKLAMAERPDLVLADIQLADGSSGVDAVRDILAAYTAPVIFITAYPDRLLTGARPEPTFLISKPFQTETVQAAVSQALFFHLSDAPT